jgi:hypothetical protein
MRKAAETESVHKHTWKGKSKGSFRHGKPRVQITMPVYLFNVIRGEAERRERSVNAITIEWLEAAYELEFGEDE